MVTGEIYGNSSAKGSSYGESKGFQSDGLVCAVGRDRSPNGSSTAESSGTIGDLDLPLDHLHSPTYPVAMKNITLAIDEDVLNAVRRYAASNNTTVNALVRSALDGVAERARRQENEWDELFALADHEGARSGPVQSARGWSRDELHERSS